MTEYPTKVRLAGPGDNDRIYTLLLELEKDNGFGVAISPDKIRNQIEIGTSRHGGLIGVIDKTPNELAASIGLFHSSVWYSDEPNLTELWLFVEPESRTLGLEKPLFDFAKWARQGLSAALQRNIPLITSVSSPTRLDAKTRLWKRLSGGVQVGSIFTVT